MSAILLVKDALGNVQTLSADSYGGVLTPRHELELGGALVSGSNPLPVTFALTTVDVGNFPTLQPVTGTVTLSGLTTVDIGNFPTVQTVAGTVTLSGLTTVDVGNFPTSTLIGGPVTLAAGGTVTTVGTLAVSNFPTSTLIGGPVTLAAGGTVTTVGTLAVSNFPGTQAVNGAVTVSSGTVTLSGSPTVTVSNQPTQYVEGATIATASGFASFGQLPGGVMQALTLNPDGSLLVTAEGTLAISNQPTQYSEGQSTTLATGFAALGQTPGNVMQVVTLDAAGNAMVNVAAATTLNVTLPPDPSNAGATYLVGDPNGDFAGISLLDQALTEGSGFALNARVINQPLSDTTGAIILSDAVPINVPPLPIGATLMIDTTGYESVNITTQALAGNVFASNDKATWSALSGAPLVLGALVTAVAANTGYSFPCIARWLRVTVTTAGTMTIYLRSAGWVSGYTTTVPSGTAVNNVAQFGGTNIVTAGVAGIPSIGGNIAPGTAPTVNPVPVGGIDTSGLTRRVLTDTAGRVIETAYAPDFTGTVRQIAALAASYVTAGALATQDTGVQDGNTLLDLLASILLELKIANHQHYLLNTQGGSPLADEPQSLRNDPSLFLPN